MLTDTKDTVILNENDLMDVSEFVVSKYWPNYEGISKFEFGIVKLVGLDTFPPNVNKGLNKGKSPHRCKQTEKTFSLLFILLSCGDISLNPGPNYKYPCGLCEKPVRKKQHGILCDGCDLWHHIKCLKMPYDIYIDLSENETVDWYCQKCILPSFSDSYFETSSRSSNWSETSSISTKADSASVSAISIQEDESESKNFRELRDLRSKHRKNLIFFTCQH